MDLSLARTPICVWMKHHAFSNQQHVTANPRLVDQQTNFILIYPVNHGYEVHILHQSSIQNYLSTMLT